ncbi:2'-5' RNA ligase family protein [Humibacillus sp. DSM 29435]|uniref:2'-5' RNA ligase family protein n=1 Tax=Humibacillus sp. DSM 29435 TaxID=1869167 RepID=UPI0020C76111|nr:2'-5' RNA ligase family protein [Humibacillus sp. DSM 29435]
MPVPPLEAFVRARTAHYDATWLSPDAEFGHAHVTALGPFLPPDATDAEALRRVAEIACRTEPFAFTLGGVDTFPNGIIHLVPEPDEPFRTLTAALCEAFPSYLPYGGAFGDVHPHLTLDARSATVSETSTVALLEGLLPVVSRAERLDLALWQQNGCRVLTSWLLGSAPAS